MKVYKVVSVRNGKKYSFARNGIIPVEYAVEYIPGEWTKPVVEGTKLFVFETLQDAKNFVIMEYLSFKNEIWECECKDLIDPPRYISNCLSFNKFINDFLSFRKKKKKISKFTSANATKSVPSGTKLTSSLKLVKKVS